MMNRSYTKPENQPIKGIFVFKDQGEKAQSDAHDLLKSINCKIVSSSKNRITITTSRGNLQKIKHCWLSPTERSDLSIALHEQISQIIIGGNV